MQKITKGNVPPELRAWKEKNPRRHYADLSDCERRAIRRDCVREQRGLCAFCCARITADASSSHNAHLQSRTRFPKYSLDWTNIVASCNNRATCGSHQGQDTPPLSPLMPECETELRFYVSGRVEGLTKRARETIDLFNLNEKLLCLKRKKAIGDFLYINGYYPPEEDPVIWDAEIWREILRQCEAPDADGNLAPFAPALAGIGRHLLTSSV